MTNEFWESILSDNKIVIYGAGYYGRTIVEFLKALSLLKYKVTAIAVTQLQKNEYIEGLAIQELAQIENLKREKIVVAASEEKQEEMIATLHKNGFKNYVKSDEISIRIMHSLTKSMRREEIVARQMNESRMCLEDLLYGQNFNRVIEASTWLKKKDFAAGGMAVSNKYLYTLYKILDSGRFTSCLDVGMGQTTKLISQYINYNPLANLVVIENDSEWIEFFSPNLEVTQNIKIEQLDYIFTDVQGEMVRVYEGFSEALKGKKFDFISIDAPLGGDMKMFSRIDLLSVIPHCLRESWVIMLDDVHRQGETNSYKKILEKLEEHQIEYETCIHYCGEKAFAIIRARCPTPCCTPPVSPR